MSKLDKSETLVIIGDMTYVREVTKLTCIVVCVYISSLTQFAHFLSLFEQVSLLSKQFNVLRHRFCCYMCLPNALLLRGVRVRVTHFTHSPIYNFSISIY